MGNAWDDMKRVKEDEYFMKQDQELLHQKEEEIQNYGRAGTE
jgi:hypothetical protein